MNTTIQRDGRSRKYVPAITLKNYEYVQALKPIIIRALLPKTIKEYVEEVQEEIHAFADQLPTYAGSLYFDNRVMKVNLLNSLLGYPIEHDYNKVDNTNGYELNMGIVNQYTQTDEQYVLRLFDDYDRCLDYLHRMDKIADVTIGQMVNDKQIINGITYLVRNALNDTDRLDMVDELDGLLVLEQ